MKVENTTSQSTTEGRTRVTAAKRPLHFAAKLTVTGRRWHGNEVGDVLVTVEAPTFLARFYEQVDI